MDGCFGTVEMEVKKDKDLDTWQVVSDESKTNQDKTEALLGEVSSVLLEKTSDEITVDTTEPMIESPVQEEEEPVEVVWSRTMFKIDRKGIPDDVVGVELRGALHNGRPIQTTAGTLAWDTGLPLVREGDYWLLECELALAATVNFDAKLLAIAEDNEEVWEPIIDQHNYISGTAAYTPAKNGPSQKNHSVRAGFQNGFEWGQGHGRCDVLPAVPA